MSNVDELLAANAIRLKSTAPGRHYAVCPQCSAQRSVEHRKAKVLGVTIDADGARWGCNHCGWTGGATAKAGVRPNGGNGRGNGEGRYGTFITYDYTDENGVLLFQKVRTSDPKHKFWQRRPDSNGGWIKNLEGTRKVLYRLPELIEDIASGHPILVVEGEKDVDNLRAIGVPATCNPDGAAKPGQRPKWREEFSETLRGADIIIIPDNDEPGRAHAEAIERMSAGVARSVRLFDLAEYWPQCPKDGGDISDWLDAGHTREELDNALATAKADALPQPELNGGPKGVGVTPSGLVPPLRFADIGAWATQEPPPREWAVRDRFPLRNVALLSGEGSIGKTILLMQLAAAHVLAKDWIFTMPEPGPAIYVNCEDEETELHRRFADIAAHYGATLSELKEHLHILSLAGQDAVLGYPDRAGLVKPTPLFHKLQEAARDIRPKLIGLDTSADIFAGQENDRSQVRQFIGLLRGMAIGANAAVIICAHPSLTGINSGSGLSGSTAWHNSVRARAYMHSITTEDGAEPDTSLRQFDFMKSNYGPIAESVVLRWKAGVFVPEPKAGSVEKLAAEAKADEIFLTLLDRYNAQNRSLSDKANANNFAPRIFAGEAEAKAAGIKKAALKEAMSRLFAADKIRLEPYGAPSRGWQKFVRT